MNNFVYNVPTKVYFGKDQLFNLEKELNNYGKKVLLTYGGGSIKKSGLYQKVMDILEKGGFSVFELSGISPNPRIDSVREGARICKEEEIDILLAVGGGSVIDCTKFIAAAMYYDEDPWDILLGKVKVKKALPIIDILTLSATGSEMDSGGVISNPETKDKLGMGFSVLLPKVSFLDPTNTYSVSPYQTACGAADILSHIIEVYFNMDTDLFMLDTVMEGLMKTVIKYARIAIKEPENYEARANLMWASSWAINGFVNGGKRQAWSAHPIEHELSAYYDITHGLGLAILTPRWMAYVLDETNKSKFYQFGTEVFGIDKNLSEMEVSKLAIEKLSEFLFEDMGLTKTLKELNIDEENFLVMSEKAVKNGALEYAFKPLSKEDVLNIYNMCL